MEATATVEAPTEELVEREKTTREIVQKARRLLIQGWAQGDFCIEDENGSQHFCMLGALSLAETGEPGNEDAQVIDVFGIASGLGGWDDIATWNDDPLRTKDEVIALFDRVLAA